MILKQIFYKLPNSLKDIISKLSAQFHSNIENDFIFNKEIGKNYKLTIKDKKNIIKRLKFSVSK